jgi:hypothetical protein
LHHSSPSSFPLNPETCTFEKKVIKINNTLKQYKLKIVPFSYCLFVKSPVRTHKPYPHRPKVALFLWVEISRFKRFRLQRRSSGIRWQQTTVNTQVRGTVRLPLDSSTLGTVCRGCVGEFVGPLNIQLESNKDALRELLVFVNICRCLWGKYNKYT